MMAYINAAGVHMPPTFVVKGNIQLSINNFNTADGPKEDSEKWRNKTCTFARYPKQNASRLA